MAVMMSVMMTNYGDDRNHNDDNLFLIFSSLCRELVKPGRAGSKNNEAKPKINHYSSKYI